MLLGVLLEECFLCAMFRLNFARDVIGSSNVVTKFAWNDVRLSLGNPTLVTNSELIEIRDVIVCHPDHLRGFNLHFLRSDPSSPFHLNI